MKRPGATVSSGATIRTALRLYRARTTGNRGRRLADAQRWASLVAAYPDHAPTELARLWLRANVALAYALGTGNQDSPPSGAGAAMHHPSLRGERTHDHFDP